MSSPAQSANKVRFDFDPLRHRRQSFGYSQGQLGLRAGMHWQTVYRIETNQTVPSLARVYALARALGCPATDLFRVVE